MALNNKDNKKKELSAEASSVTSVGVSRQLMKTDGIKNRTTNKTKFVSYLLLALLIVLSAFLFMGGKEWQQAGLINLSNVSDSFMLLSELSTESGGRFGGSYINAQKSHAEMIRTYIKNMNEKQLSSLLDLPILKKKNIVKCLEETAKTLEEESHSQEEARTKIKEAAIKIANFILESGLYTGEPIIIPKYGDIPSDSNIRKEIEISLKESHEAAEIYVTDPNVAHSEDACMANRRAIVKLYITRFTHHIFIEEEELIQFSADMNRAIYENKLLQQDETIKEQYDKAVKSGVAVEEIEETDYKKLEKHTDSEMRRLQLLEAILDNDFYRANDILLTSIMIALPEIQFPIKSSPINSTL